MALSFTEVLDLALARIAEAEGELDEYVNLFDLLADVTPPIKEKWIYDAAEALDDQGLIKWMKVMGRENVPVALTGAGRLYVEQGGETGIIEKYQAQPFQFISISGEGHNIAFSQTGDVRQEANREEHREIYLLLSKIEDGIGADEKLSEEERTTYREDLEVVRGQLGRPAPNKAAIMALLQPMASLASVGSLVAQIVELLS